MAFANLNGLMSTMLNVSDYSSEEKPDIMGITETKLKSDVDFFKYWRVHDVIIIPTCILCLYRCILQKRENKPVMNNTINIISYCKR